MNKMIMEAYYLTPEMIRFLLIENLALKNVLRDQGLISVENYKVAQAEAANILDAKVKLQVDEWKKQYPEIVEAMESTEAIIHKEDHPQTSENVAVASTLSLTSQDQPLSEQQSSNQG